MAEASRRVILKPSGLAAAQAARLAELLAAAVAAQQRLAVRTPFILQITGDLEQTDEAFVLPHEPAAALPVGPLFDARAPRADEAQLLHSAASLLDVLAAAHAGDGGRPLVHGSLAPGVLLVTADGLIKVADLGIAPAICSALGPDSYVNLAVGPESPHAQRLDASGVWEVLAADEFTRDDRLCAFIDPEKLGENMLASFEPASDIIAAGFLLHLLAEHHHPYLFGDPEAHRVLEMAMMIAGHMPTAARRKDLRESENKAARLWCEQVTRMLARLPPERPTARELMEALAPHVEDYLDRGRRSLDRKRGELEAKAAAQAESQAAQSWLGKLRKAAESQNWEALEQVLRAKPNVKRWPAGVLEEAERFSEALRAEQAEHESRRAAEIERELAQDWLRELQGRVDASDWAAAAERLAKRPALSAWPDKVTADAARIDKQVHEQLAALEAQRRAREEQQRLAQHWLEGAKALAARKDWAAALDVLNAPPALENWPADVRTAGDVLEKECRRRLDEQRSASERERLAKVTALAQELVGGLIKKHLAAAVDPGLLEASLDFVEWTSPVEGANGKANLSVTLRATADLPRGDDIAGVFHFQTEGKAPRVVQIESGLLERLTQRLAAAQKSQLALLLRPLREGLFPAASLSMELKELVEQAVVTVRLLGAKASEGVVELRVRWSPREMHWEFSDVAPLQAKVLELATADARRAVEAAVGQSAELKRYARRLALDVTPTKTEAGRIPRVLQFAARLAFRMSEAERVELATLGVSVAKSGQGVLEGDLRGAEAALRERIVAAQSHERQTLQESLEQPINAAAARVRITPNPKRIKDPTDQISFELRPRTGDAVMLAADWKPEKFGYERQGGWDDALSRLLTPPAPTVSERAQPKPAPERQSAQTPEPRPAQSDEGAETRQGGGKRGLILVGVPLLVVVLAGGVYFLMRGGGNGGGNGNVVVRNENHNSPEPPANNNNGASIANANQRPANENRNIAVANENQNVAGANENRNAAANENQNVAAANDNQNSGPIANGNRPPENANEGPPVTPPVAAGESFRKWWETRRAATAASPFGALASEPSESQAAAVALLAGLVTGAPALTDVKENGPSAVAAKFTVSQAGVTPALTIDVDYTRASEAGSDWAPSASNNAKLEDLATRATAAAFDAASKAPGWKAAPDLLTQLKSADAALGALIDQAGLMPADLGAATRENAAGVVRFKQAWPGGDATAVATLTYTFDSNAHTWAHAWEISPQYLAVAKSQSGGRSLETARAGVEKAIKESRYKDAVAQYWTVAAQLDAAPEDANVKKWAAIRAALPPPWHERTGFAAKPDEGNDELLTTYPRTLVLQSQPPRTFALVSIPPDDASRKAAGNGAPAGGWRVYYVDTHEWGGEQPEAVETLADAAKRLQGVSPDLDLPMRGEYFLAALKLAGDPRMVGLLGGAYEWCRDDAKPKDGPAWACGGVSLPDLPALFPAPPEPEDAAKLWQWLQNPLISHVREQGDGMTSFRPTMHVFAAGP